MSDLDEGAKLVVGLCQQATESAEIATKAVIRALTKAGLSEEEARIVAIALHASAEAAARYNAARFAMSLAQDIALQLIIK